MSGREQDMKIRRVFKDRTAWSQLSTFIHVRYEEEEARKRVSRRQEYRSRLPRFVE